MAQIKRYPKLACHPHKIANFAIKLIFIDLELVLCYLKPRLLYQHLSVCTKLDPMPYIALEAPVHLHIYNH